MRAAHPANQNHPGWRPNLGQNGESKTDFLNRLVGGIDPKLNGLNSDQYESIKHHIETYDFPLDFSQWDHIGREAGFKQIDCVYRDEGEKYAVLRFS